MGKQDYNSVKRNTRFVVGEPDVVWGNIVDVPVELTNVTTELAGKENVGVAATEITTHEGEADPHPQYLTQVEGNALYAPIAGAGGGLGGLAVVQVPNNALEHSQTVTATGVTSSKVIICSLANHTDADENSAELLDIASMSGLPGTDQISFTLSFITPTSGNVKLNWSAI